ncbi:hypothetical protein PAGU1579_06110 [Veillonella tobetsuensis]|jgi:hypothetical protein|uniref:Uncharacterized protein n=2 Tax=Veillonella tobetsuensis TaxID=1110546 RepID=A0A480B7X4_9FIRM|nr:hypothetical protein PAGU1579_06110 [Veillonella tobetsuensis]
MLMKFKQLGIVKGMLSIVIVIGILVGAGYGLYYQFVYKQSPEYSLRVIYKAIQDGDTDTFFAMVDGEGILHKVFDPYIEKLLKESDGRNISQTNSKGETKILNLGEALLFTAIDNYYLDVKEVLLNQDLKAHIPHRPDPKDPFKDNLQTLKEVGRYELISIKEKNKNDGVVNIEIRALDTKTNETKVFPVEMTQMDNKMWRVTGYDYKTYSLPYDGFDRI